MIAFEQICAAGEEGVGLKAMLEPVAEALGNTPAISRKSYVHPGADRRGQGGAGSGFGLQCPRPTKYLSSAERGLIAFLGRKTSAGKPGAQTMNEQASLDIQAGQLWGETLAWLSSHSLQILLGFAAGAVIVALLLGVKWLGVRICGTDPDHVHWRTVLGRVLAGTRLWFMVALGGAAGGRLCRRARAGRDDDRRSISSSPRRCRSPCGCARSSSA